MIKCDICTEKIQELFLGKINGTFIRKEKERKTVCSNCQRKFGDTIFQKL